MNTVKYRLLERASFPARPRSTWRAGPEDRNRVMTARTTMTGIACHSSTVRDTASSCSIHTTTTLRDQTRCPSGARRQLRPQSRGRHQLATVSFVRRKLLHLPATARLTVAGDMAVRNEQPIGLVPIDEEEAAERETLGRVFTPAVAIEPCAGPGFGYCRLPALGRTWHAAVQPAYRQPGQGLTSSASP